MDTSMNHSNYIKRLDHCLWLCLVTRLLLPEQPEFSGVGRNLDRTFPEEKIRQIRGENQVSSFEAWRARRRSILVFLSIAVTGQDHYSFSKNFLSDPVKKSYFIRKLNAFPSNTWAKLVTSCRTSRNVCWSVWSEPELNKEKVKEILSDLQNLRLSSNFWVELWFMKIISVFSVLFKSHRAGPLHWIGRFFKFLSIIVAFYDAVSLHQLEACQISMLCIFLQTWKANLAGPQQGQSQ